MMIAHDSHIRVLSDLEFNTEINDREASSTFDNLLLVGGPKTNKFAKKLVGNDISLSQRLKASFPVNFTVNSFDENGPEGYLDSFKLNKFLIGGLSDAAIFTFPVVYSTDVDLNLTMYKRHARWIQESGARLAAVVFSNSPEGYLRLSRMAAPTVPPMVRSPFANYIPDFMVIDDTVWDRGFGAVKLAGFWDSNWKFSSSMSYVRSDVVNSAE
jgi:hypothetical protein